MSKKYYSQYKQDKFLNEVIFNNKDKGFFVDIGAHDGVTINNTYFFENSKEWEGICVEPNPTVYQKLINNRKCKTLNVCIGNEDKKVKFTQITGYSEMLSGITEKYDERHLKRISEEIKKKGGQETQIEIDMRSLNSLKEVENKQIDFISIDTEGNEFEIVKSINFDQLKVLSLVIENNYKDERIKDYLTTYGYTRMYKLSMDEVFIHKDYFNFLVRCRLLKWKMDVFAKKVLKKLGVN